MRSALRSRADNLCADRYRRNREPAIRIGDRAKRRTAMEICAFASSTPGTLFLTVPVIVPVAACARATSGRMVAARSIAPTHANTPALLLTRRPKL